MLMSIEDFACAESWQRIPSGPSAMDVRASVFVTIEKLRLPAAATGVENLPLHAPVRPATAPGTRSVISGYSVAPLSSSRVHHLAAHHPEAPLNPRFAIRALVSRSKNELSELRDPVRPTGDLRGSSRTCRR